MNDMFGDGGGGGGAAAVYNLQQQDDTMARMPAPAAARVAPWPGRCIRGTPSIGQASSEVQPAAAGRIVLRGQMQSLRMLRVVLIGDGAMAQVGVTVTQCSSHPCKGKKDTLSVGASV
eukprot:scaffold20378_cov21-Tisochrysis_lutea.AAC.2